MAAFLQIVGAVFVALILVVIVTLLFLRWKLKAWASKMAAQVQEFGGMMEQFVASGGPMAAALGGMLEPLTIQLHPTDDEPDEDFALQITAWTKGLTAAGFQPVGDYTAQPTLLWLRALIHPESGVAAALYIMPMAGAWYDVTAEFDDQTSLTLSDNQRELVDMPPWSELIRHEAGTPPAKAYEKLLRKIGPRSVVPYTVDNFVQRFEETYRRGMIWRAKRGDSAEEFRRIAAVDGGDAPDNQFVRQMLNSRKLMRAHQIDELLKEQWLKDSNLSAYDYERIEDRLIVIHDLTPPDLLLDMWGAEYGEDDDEDDDKRAEVPDVAALVNESNPREAFRTLQERLSPGGRFEHYAAVEGEISGDLWLRPANL